MIPTCNLCPTPAFFDFGCKFLLCADCAATMLKRFEILVSDGETVSSLPSGENEPSVTLASTPSEFNSDTPVSSQGLSGVTAAASHVPGLIVAAGSFDEMLNTPGYVRRSAAA